MIHHQDWFIRHENNKKSCKIHLIGLKLLKKSKNVKITPNIDQNGKKF